MKLFFEPIFKLIIFMKQGFWREKYDTEGLEIFLSKFTLTLFLKIINLTLF